MNDGATEAQPLPDVLGLEALGSTGMVLQDTYTLGPRIGMGGMGEVYEATHVRLPGRFAVKILRPALLTNQEAISRFCREAEIMSALRHPHIVQIFDFNTSREGFPYFVMEYLAGVDLETRLASTAELSLVALVRIVEATASALSAAHALDIVHRDLKPANIFLLRGEGLESDFVKVLDFGISKIADAGRCLSQSSVVMGTPEFMAPEQALGLAGDVDARADQFALAAIAYTMLTGHQPFQADDPVSLLYRIVHEQPSPLSTYLSWDAGALQSTLDRAMAKRREDRFDNIADFAASLRAAAELAIGRPSPSASTTVRARRNHAARTASRGPSPVKNATRLRRVDRIPHGPQRAVVLGLGVLGLAAAIAHNGWYHGFQQHAIQLEQDTVSLVQGASRAPVSKLLPSARATTMVEAVPSHGPTRYEIKALPDAPRPLAAPAPVLASGTVGANDEVRPPMEPRLPVERAARRAERGPARPAHHHHAVFRSGWQVIEIPYRAPHASSDIDDSFSPPARFPEPSLTPPSQSIPEWFPAPPPTPLPLGRDPAPVPAPSPRTRPSGDDPMPIS